MALRPRRIPVTLDAAALAPTLHELMPIGDGELPAEVLGYCDAGGNVRRMVAAYPNGWKVTVWLNTELEVTRVETSIKLVTKRRWSA